MNEAPTLASTSIHMGSAAQVGACQQPPLPFQQSVSPQRTVPHLQEKLQFRAPCTRSVEMRLTDTYLPRITIAEAAP